MGNFYHARCLCGLRLALHRDRLNRSVSCVEAARRHPYATCRCQGFKHALAKSAFALVRRKS